MMRLILGLAVVSAIVLLAKSIINSIAGSPEKAEGEGVYDMVKDPVCGKFIPMESAVAKNIGEATRFYCSDACALKDNRG